MTFPLSSDGRTIRAVPGSRKTAVERDAALGELRELLATIDTRLFARLPVPAERDDDPLLGPLLAVCGPRVHVPAELAILPPSRRFNRPGDRRVFAAKPYMDGVTGYVLAPSELRPELAICGYSESGLLLAEEYAAPHEWLLELCAALVGASPGRDPDELWEIIAGDLPPGEPARPVAPPLRDGVWRRERGGVIDREETYRDGLRDGPLRWWSVDDYLPPGADPMTEPEVRRGAVMREGTFVRGFAHGDFRFCDDLGRPTHEVRFERGWPVGRCTAYPEGTSGLCEPASIDYELGVPVRWTIPPLAHASVAVVRAGAPPATLAELATGRPIVLVDCSATTAHAIPDALDRELATCGALIVGIAPAPGRAMVGSHAVEVVADPEGKLARAYGHRHRRLLSITLLRAGGQFAGAGRLASMRALARKLAG
ncbi:MAG TPA: hypothetical protein VLX92_09000 [Kofleriaceae bacterium]|nr:hypothetical protein [Kofleriaceae bacterium]